jgi:hypothetical protein
MSLRNVRPASHTGDLWSLQGKIPPPFESHAEKRWVKENQASPYGLQEKLPVGVLFTPGATEKSAGKGAGSGPVDRCKAPLLSSGGAHAKIEGAGSSEKGTSREEKMSAPGVSNENFD